MFYRSLQQAALRIFSNLRTRPSRQDWRHAAAKERYKQKGRDAYSAPFSTAGRKTDGEFDFRQAIDAIYSHHGAGGGGGKGEGLAGGGAQAYQRSASPAGRESHHRTQGQASPRTRGEKTRAESREPGPAKRALTLVESDSPRSWFITPRTDLSSTLPPSRSR